MLKADYKLLKHGRVNHSGLGITLNISTGGVLFVANEEIHPNLVIKLSLHWPFLLDSVSPLKLVIDGRVVRNDGNQIGVRIKHHDFYIASATTKV
jgi:hypothetical protein